MELNVLFLLHPDYSMIVKSLANRGYNPAVELRRRGLGGHPNLLARKFTEKGSIDIRYDLGRRVIGVETFDKDMLLAGGEDLLSSLREAGVNLNENAIFYEYLAELRLKIEKELFLNIKLPAEVAGIIRDEPEVVSLKFKPRKLAPTSHSYCEFNIEKLMSSEKGIYLVDIIMRDEEVKEVIEFIKNIEKMITELIRFL